MGKKILSMKKNYIGVDIGARNIKMIEIKPGTPRKILAVSSLPTPLEAVEGETIVNSSALSNALRRGWQQLGTTTQEAVTTVSGKNIITRYIRLPKMSPKEVASTLKWEVDKYIPVTEEKEMIVEHQVLGELRENGAAQLNILLAAVPRKLIYALYEAFQQAGLTLTAVEIAPLSLWRSLGTHVGAVTSQVVPQEEAFFVLDIGAKGSSFAAFQGENLKFSRDIPIGGDVITESIAAAVGLEFAAAQEIKEKEGGLFAPDLLNSLPEEKVRLDRYIRKGMMPLLGEIHRSVNFYCSQFESSQPQALVLSGGTAKLPGIRDFLAQQLELTVALGLQDFPLTEQYQKFRFGESNCLDPAFAVAAGLSLRGVEA
ncbi:MAG: type IV pilus assembly protein PilM [Bacillota bacterium]|jgi:type IV pilus assembly protein PilM|nr:type IV pilus assembly protein PilM [Clostridia bacterium]